MEEMKKIILVTHGEAEQDKPDPKLTKEGRRQMKELKPLVAGKFSYVISGIGRRHKESCKIIAGRAADFQSEIAGVSETLSSDGTNMIFSDGIRIPVDEYEKTRYREIIKRTPPFIKKILKSKQIKGDILVVGGRIMAIGAGFPVQKARSAFIYHIWLTPTGKIKIREQRMLE
jgi:broad specificity phosphatase PhoE